jgi:hypothetical protein
MSRAGRRLYGIPLRQNRSTVIHIKRESPERCEQSHIEVVRRDREERFPPAPMHGLTERVRRQTRRFPTILRTVTPREPQTDQDNQWHESVDHPRSQRRRNPQPMRIHF